MSSTWNKLVNLVIRPPRAQYDPNEHLPGPRFRIAGVTHVRRDIDLAGADGLTLKCSHYEPEVRGNDPLPCVIYLHGNSGSRCDATEAIRLLLPARITVFAVDLGGSGMSEGEYVTLGVRETKDVECIVNHLRDQGLTSKIGLWGTSMGAVTAIMYANRDPSIAGVVLDSPFSSLPKLMLELVAQFTKGSRVGVPKMAARMALSFVRSSVKSRAKFDINDLDLRKVAPSTFCPALFAHGKDDDFIPPHHSETLHELYAGDKNYIAIDGDHNSPRPAFFFDSTVIFFCNVLDPPPTSYQAGAMGRGSANGLGPPVGAIRGRDPGGRDVDRRGSPAPVELVRRRHEPRETPEEDDGASVSENVATLVAMGFDEAKARAALRRFRQKRAAARAFAGDVHIRALLDELAGGADEQAREKRQRVQAARAGLHRALAEDAGRAASDDADDAELDEAARRDGAAGWDPPRARLLAHALCAALAADPAGAGPEAVVASRLLVALARLARRVDDAAARAPKAAERVVAALVDGVDTLDALCRAVVASCVEIKILRRVRAESSTRRTG